MEGNAFTPGDGSCETRPAGSTTPDPFAEVAAAGALDGNYAGSYQLVSSDNRCLSVDPTTQATFGSSTVIVENCDGPSRQKWNAPASPRSTNIVNLNEDQGNG